MTTKAASKPAHIYRSGQLYKIPPGQLVLERNIRDAKPDRELLGSVRALGVLQPITAVIGDDGRLIVRLGHRRTLAAVETGQPLVPVYVVDVDDTADVAEVSRIIAQHDENTLRAGLTAGDEVGVVEQLAAFGLSADEISDQARIGKDRVDTALVVSRSKVAAKATGRYESMTLDQAATVAEFDDDAEAAKKLIVVAVKEPAVFEHVAQQLRDDRIRATRRDQVLADLKAAGVPVVKQPEYHDKTKRLHQLRNDKGKEITEAAHQTCPGHVAWLYPEWMWIDSAGTVLTARADGSRQIQLDGPRYGCKDPKKHGHTDSHSMGSTSSRPAAADMSDTEREKAKDERRLVIDNNKAWDAATAVRRKWLLEFSTRKTPPAGAASFLAGVLVTDLDVLTDYRARSTTDEIGGKDHGKDLTGASEARATVIALVRAFGGYEAVSTRDSWRGNGKTSPTGRYLRFLEACGYGLSDVEKFALTSRTI